MLGVAARQQPNHCVVSPEIVHALHHLQARRCLMSLDDVREALQVKQQRAWVELWGGLTSLLHFKKPSICGVI